MKRFTKPVSLIFLLLLSSFLYAQTDTSAAKTTSGGQTPLAKLQDAAKTDTATYQQAAKPENLLTISTDVRVRAELRHGYRNIALKDTTAAFFINQRSRLNISYKRKRFDLYASLQDARVWGQQDPREGQGTTSSVTASSASTFPVYFFELYAEPHFNDKWSVRIGRQRIVYDNQRLFAENDWRLTGASHDAIRFIYNNNKNFTTELAGAYNQSAENNFGSNYQPNGFKNYKDLVVHYLNYKVGKTFVVTTINAMDGYQSATRSNTAFQRFTSGGRLEYQSENWYATISGYYQYGKDSSGKNLSAFYVQPEIKYSVKTFNARLGMELLSGQDSANANDNNFVPLYGVAHSFNGTLDFFTTFPADIKMSGLINPYLFFQFQKNKITARLQNHLFYKQTNKAFTTVSGNKKYLGFESDLRLGYKINSFTDFEYGFSLAAVSQSLVEVRNKISTAADADKYSKTPYWTYLSIRFTPVIGKFSF